MDGFFNYVLMAGLLVCSAFFSASETAFFSLGRRARRRLCNGSESVSHLVAALLDTPQELLITILFGNMLVNVLYFSISSLSAMAALRSEQSLQAALIGVGSLVALVLFGEVLPKNLSVLMPEQVVRVSAVPIYSFQVIILPARKVLGGIVRLLTYYSATSGSDKRYVTADELKMLVELSAEKGVIDRAERDMIEEVVELNSARVKEIMVPRVDLECFDISKGMTAFQELVRRTHNTEVPVYEGSLDNVIGIAHAREVLLSKTNDLRNSLRPPLIVPEVALIETVLRLFRERKEQTAIAVDEYGGFAGLVTIEDIVEEIVGEIQDEYEPVIAEPVETLAPGRYRLAGNIGIRDWADLFDVEMEYPKFDTLAGLVIFLLGRMPREGDTVNYGNLTFTVERELKRRIVSILVEVRAVADEGAQRVRENDT